ncbi:MAG: ribosome biogenesis GTP-binding protein YihA/YsxC [Bacilli bacterium]|nr:ribosome biogenesis GTP-binding protein YihA/YsxC [Bacilli bacterium]
MINFRNTVFVKSAPDVSFMPANALPAVLFVGKSNVGKSSLINALCSHKGLAKVSSTPGATKYLNYFLLDEKYYLIDAPGYGFVANKKHDFNQMMAGLFKAKVVKGVVFIVDSRRTLTDDDKVFYNSLIDLHLPFVLVLAKADKLNQSERVKIMKDVHQHFVIVKDNECLFTSTLKKENIKKLQSKIESLLKY